MTIQTNSNVLVALKRETTTGTAATAGSATRVRLIGSPGLSLKRAAIVAQELRGDGNTSMGRLGAKSVDGSYESELTVGGHTDIVLEAVMRSVWVTSYSVGFTTMTTVAIGTMTLTAAGGDFVGGQGVRVGDVFTLSGTTVSGNHNLRNVVTAIGSLTIVTTTGAFTTLTASATGTMTVLKKVKSATTPTRYSHTVEQYDEDTDLSELFLGCRVIGVTVSGKPGEMAKMTTRMMGMDRTALATGTSPWFTSPAETTGLGLIADDSAIIYNGAVVTNLTGFDLDFTIGAAGQPVLGTFVSPDIFDNVLDVKCTVTALREDFSQLTLFDAETEFACNLMLQELATAPKPCLNFYLPRVKIKALEAGVGGGDGAKIETRELMVGPKVAATGFDGTIVTISSSAT